jgi:hypothetical protein
MNKKNKLVAGGKWDWTTNTTTLWSSCEQTPLQWEVSRTTRHLKWELSHGSQEIGLWPDHEWNSRHLWHLHQKGIQTKVKIYTLYCVWCHMVFHVTMVTFLITLLMNKFTSTVMNGRNLNEIPIPIFETKFDIFLYPNNSVRKYCHDGWLNSSTEKITL